MTAPSYGGHESADIMDSLGLPLYDNDDDDDDDDDCLTHLRRLRFLTAVHRAHFRRYIHRLLTYFLLGQFCSD